MKLKYKKAILLILISTSGIGILTLSLTPNSNHKGKAQTTAVDDVTLLANASGAVTGTSLTAATDSSLVPTEALTPIPTAIPTPLPVYDFEEDSNPEIQTLFENYYAAKVNHDVEKMKLVMSNVDNAPTKKQMENSTQYVEACTNIKCYTKKSFEEGTYIVYVYYEIKFLNLNTPAPAVKKFYVITDDKGELKIYPDELDEKTAEYYAQRDQDADVQKLIKETNEKSEEAKASDEYLKIFWENLEKSLASE